MFGNMTQRLSDVLIEQKFISKEAMSEIIQKERNSNGMKTLEEIILEEQIISEEDLAKAIAIQNELEYIAPGELDIDIKFLKEQNLSILSSVDILPYKKDDTYVYIATFDPNNMQMIDAVRSLFPNTLAQYVITTKKEIKKNLLKIQTLESLKEIISAAKREIKNPNPIENNEKSAILQLMEIVISSSIQKGASDIHIEPDEDSFAVRGRIDGMLQELFQFESELYPPLISRIKLSSGLDIAEKRRPQDGRFSLVLPGKDGNKREFDFRISTLPLIKGESIVFRILDKNSINVELDKLGFSPENTEKFRNATKSPYGLIFVTGPTGSGKTTTLYAGLNEVKGETKKIITVEDPVEYQMSGIQQVQVNTKADLTFGAALRSILRQDPDIIMIGEARDLETLSIAIKAALTGHLVFTTLHTNDAPSAVMRVIDMGIEPFLVANAIVAIQAQRLIRTNCPYCTEEYTPTKKLIDGVKEFFPKDLDIEKVKWKHGVGCANCNETGYQGRTIISEVLEFTPELVSYIINEENIDQQELVRIAQEKQGFTTMFENGMLRAIDGSTSMEEILRVAKM
jgi:type II secretory ATPase GspE/PulE/Tfp pilus assembly ATPase PilB-like protein